MSQQPSPAAEQDERVDVPALDDPATVEALGQYRCYARRALGAGVGLLLVAVVAVQPNNGNPGAFLGFVATVGFGAGFFMLYMGVSGLRKTWRARRIMKREPWRRRSATYRIVCMGANGQPALLFKADDSNPEAVCSVSATVWRYRQLPQGCNEQVLVVGDPRQWCVVAPPDRRVLLVAKRPWLPWWRRRLGRWAVGS